MARPLQLGWQSNSQVFRVALLEAGRASHASLGGTEPPASWDPSQRRWINWADNGGLQVTRYDLPGNYEALQCWDRRCPESWLTDVPYFQCKVLGGCGVMNGALVQRPNAASWPHRHLSVIPPFFAVAH